MFDVIKRPKPIDYIYTETEVKRYEDFESRITALENMGGAKDGITPHIGENGNWFIGETDTEVCAHGQKGDKGDKGDTPRKGIDYYTEADKSEIVSAVLIALPKYNGEVESV
jgi:hypothetical protein